MVSVLITLLLGAVSARAADVPSGTLALFVGFEAGYSPPAIFEMKREVESLLDLDGLDIKWRDIGSRRHEVFDHIVIVRFSGECRLEPAGDDVAPRVVLGYSHVSDGGVLPFAEIDCRRVRGIIGAHHPARFADAVFGRALGRVMAHEIFHILTGTLRHAKAGVAKETLTRSELTAERLGFEKGNLEAMRRKVLRPQTPSLAASDRSVLGN